MNPRYTRMISAALFALALTSPPLSRQSFAQARVAGYSVPDDSATDSTFPSRTVTLDGTISRVDVDRDRVTFDTDDGRRFTLDTYRSDITLRSSNSPGRTADLSPGMRLHVNGTQISSSIIEADRVRVLRDAETNPPLRRYPPTATEGDTDSINLRGTVASVDQRRGSFVVHINQHTRTVFLDDSTDLTGVNHDTRDRVPLRPGDRVTVTGTLRADGTVAADTVSQGRAVDAYRTGDYRGELVGRITQRSNRYTSRDIKVRDEAEREVTVHVPAGTPITRDGRPISVHELSQDDMVRITGTSDGDAFRAERIDVIHISGNDG